MATKPRFEAQKKILEAISKGDNIEIVRKRPRNYGLTIEQLQTFNSITSDGKKRIVWHAPKWVAMDRETYDKLVSRASKKDIKIFSDEFLEDVCIGYCEYGHVADCPVSHLLDARERLSND